jgi:hypothetical protein
MSAVIEFPVSRTHSRVEATTGTTAEVIIFPGVRVERLAFDLVERLPAVRSGSAAQARAGDFDFY